MLPTNLDIGCCHNTVRPSSETELAYNSCMKSAGAKLDLHVRTLASIDLLSICCWVTHARCGYPSKKLGCKLLQKMHLPPYFIAQLTASLVFDRICMLACSG